MRSERICAANSANKALKRQRNPEQPDPNAREGNAQIV